MFDQNPFDNPGMFEDIPDPEIPLVEGITSEHGIIRSQDGDVFISFEGVVATYHELVHSDMFQMMGVMEGEAFVKGAHFLIMSMHEAWTAADRIAKGRSADEQAGITADLEAAFNLPDFERPDDV